MIKARRGDWFTAVEEKKTCTGGKIIPEVWGQAGWAPGELSPAATPGKKAVPAVLVKGHPGANSCLFYLRVRGLSSWQSVPVAKELIVFSFHIGHLEMWSGFAVLKLWHVFP